MKAVNEKPRTPIALTFQPATLAKIQRSSQPSTFPSGFGIEFYSIPNQSIPCLSFYCRRTLRRYLKSKNQKSAQ